MSTKGEDNVNTIIEACQATLAALTDPKPEWKVILDDTITALEKVKISFFLKTNLAVPITNTCRKDAEELRGLAEKQDTATFGDVITRFADNIKSLIDQSSMEGLIIT